MEQIVYADLLFLIDFSMDFLTFYIVSKLMRHKIKLVRICSASAMGSIYSVTSLNMNVGHIVALLFDIFICFVMCMTAFLEKNPKHFRKMPIYMGTFFLVSAMLGGTMTAIFSIFNQTRISLDSEAESSPSLWVFGFVALFSAIATLGGSNFLARTGRTKTGKLTVSVCGRSITLAALSDSGNLLKDPASGKDVIVIDRARAIAVVPELYGNLSGLPPEMARRLRLLPVHTATGEGLLTAFVPDSVMLDYMEFTKELDVIIALSKKGLGGDSCEAIVPAEYFT